MPERHTAAGRAVASPAWLKTYLSQKPCPNSGRNAQGYALQTLIVSAILLLAAVAASVVLYRAIDDSATSYSASDITGQAAPTKPHNFVVEPYLGATEGGVRFPTANITWAPPLYTGQPLLAGSAALLNYRVEYSCGTQPQTSSDPEHVLRPESSLTHSYVSSLAGGMFLSDDAIVSVACSIAVSAYTCPEVRVDQRCATSELTGREVYGPAARHDFTISKAPTTPALLEAKLKAFAADDDRLLVTWEDPGYAGFEGEAALGYMVTWTSTYGTSPAEVCTFGNMAVSANISENLANARGETPRREVRYQIAITPLSIHADVPADTQRFACSSTDFTSDDYYAGEPVTVTTPNLASNDSSDSFAPPQAPEWFRFAPDQLVYPEQNRWQAGTPPELIRYKVSWNGSSNADSYLLRWSRADGSDTPQTRTVPAFQTASIETHIEFTASGAYNFSVQAQNQAGASDPLRTCANILHTSDRPSVSVVPQGLELIVTVGKHSQQNYCADASNSLCLPGSPAHSICSLATSSYYIGIAETEPVRTCAPAVDVERVFALCNYSTDYVGCVYNPWPLAFDPATDSRIGNQAAAVANIAATGWGAQYLAPSTSLTIDEYLTRSLKANTGYTITVFARNSTEPCRDLFAGGSIAFDDLRSNEFEFPTIVRATTGQEALATPGVAGSLQATPPQGVSTIWTLTWDEPNNSTGLEAYFIDMFLDNADPIMPYANRLSFTLPAKLPGSFEPDFDATEAVDSLFCTVSSDKVECDIELESDLPQTAQVDVTSVYAHGLAEPAQRTVSKP